MADARSTEIGDGSDSPDGPDLAFLELPHDTVESLKARNVFINLDTRRDQILSSGVDRSLHDDYVCGTVAEKTEELEPPHVDSKRTSFMAFAQYGMTTIIVHEPYDIWLHDPGMSSEHAPVASWEGMSGGGLWRAFLKEDANGERYLDFAWLIGVVFYQTALVDGKRKLICHGPTSVYQELCERVVRGRSPFSPPTSTSGAAQS